MINASILCIIICEFRYYKESSLIDLFKIDKNLEVSFHNTVLPFCLAINLGIENGEEPLFNS